MAVIPGTFRDDTLSGTAGSDQFIGSTGSDSINNTGVAGGSDIIFYSGLTTGGVSYPGLNIPVTVNFTGLYSGTATKGAGTDSFSGIRGIYGTAFSDTLTGVGPSFSTTSFSIYLEGYSGNDVIDGQRNTINNVTYFTATSGVVVNLESTIDMNGRSVGTASDGLGGTDTLINVVKVTGSNFNDIFVGSRAADQFQASLGNDSYDGLGATNVLRYDSILSGYAITATMGAPTSLLGGASATINKTSTTGGTNYVDTAININQIRGTSSDDSFTGINGYSLYTVRFRGDVGNDTFDGRGNTVNRLEYTSATSAIQVDLAAGTATDGLGGNDTLINVRSVQGSSFNDTLLGSDASDTFEVGSAGSHFINGRAGGNTIIVSGSSAVTIDLGTTPTTDGFGGFQGSVTKSGGTDTLLNIANAYAGAGNDTLLGTPQSNLLGGDQGNNLIDGRGGNDFVDYRAFTSTSTVVTVGVTANLGDGLNATVTNPYGGTDTLVSIESIRGTQIADDLTGAVLASGDFSYVRGEGGNDIIRAPMVGTTVTADYADSLSGVTVDLSQQRTTDDGWFGGSDTLVNIQSVRGSAFNDVITGAETNDTIVAGAGDDLVNAGAGNDLLFGGAGTDNLFGGDGTDNVNGGDGNDLLFGGAEADSLYGGAGDDSLFGGLGGDTISGGAGYDYVRYDQAAAGVVVRLDLHAGSGGEAAGDLIGDDVEGIIGSAFADTLIGDGQANVILGSAGSDTILGGGGADTLLGGADADALYSGDGNDSLFGGAGGDIISGGDGYDYVRYDDASAGVVVRLDFHAGSVGDAAGDLIGDDVEGIIGTNFGDTLIGDGQANVIVGNAGNDTILGGAGDDSLVGGAGNDDLLGGPGSDILIGGADADNFYFAAADNVVGQFDTIVDFQDGLDRIYLQGWDPATLAAAEANGNVYITTLDSNYSTGVIVANATLAQVLDQVILV